MLLLLVWPQVLLAHPPPLYLSISTLPEDWVHRWLPALPLRALCVEQGLDPVQQVAIGAGDQAVKIITRKARGLGFMHGYPIRGQKTGRWRYV